MNRAEEAAGIGFALPGNIQGRPMIDTSAYDRKTQCCINGTIEGKSLHGDVALIMVHANDGIGGRPFSWHEDRVWREWAFDAHARLTCRFDCWGDQALFLLIPK